MLHTIVSLTSEEVWNDHPSPAYFEVADMDEFQKDVDLLSSKYIWPSTLGWLSNIGYQRIFPQETSAKEYVISKLRKYHFMLTHDDGKTHISMHASCRASAFQAIMVSEGCPISALEFVGATQ